VHAAATQIMSHFTRRKAAASAAASASNTRGAAR